MKDEREDSKCCCRYKVKRGNKESDVVDGEDTSNKTSVPSHLGSDWSFSAS